MRLSELLAFALVIVRSWLTQLQLVAPGKQVQLAHKGRAAPGKRGRLARAFTKGLLYNYSVQELVG